MDENDKNLMAYRVAALEQTFREEFKVLGEKMDTVLDNQNSVQTQVAVEAQKTEQLEKKVVQQEAELNCLGDKIVSLRLSLAEKIGPGALAGAGLAGLIQLGTWLAGV